MLELKDHEEKFVVKPVGIRYRCEFCNEGFQKVQIGEPMTTVEPILYPHKCDKCGKTMMLPKPYPYIDYEVEE